MFDLDDPFYRPLWIRIAVVVVCLAWSAVEFTTASAVWGGGFLAIGLYAAYRFFITFNPDTPDNKEDGQ